MRNQQMTKLVEVEVKMHRRFLVEVPNDVAFPEQWADAKVYNSALTKQEQQSVTGIETYITEDQEYIARMVTQAEFINLVK